HAGQRLADARLRGGGPPCRAGGGPRRSDGGGADRRRARLDAAAAGEAAAPFPDALLPPGGLRHPRLPNVYPALRAESGPPLLTALKTLPEAQAFPPTLLPAQPQWHNFVEGLRSGGDAPFSRYFLNSAIVAAAVTAAVMVTSLLAGYAFGTLEFPGRPVVFAL